MRKYRMSSDERTGICVGCIGIDKYADFRGNRRSL